MSLPANKLRQKLASDSPIEHTTFHGLAMHPSTQTLTDWPCPAKLNLSLQIVGQRADGYHLLQSVFQLVDYGDRLQIKPNQLGDLRFNCDQPELAGNDNLVVRAAKLLKQQAPPAQRKNLGAEITLHKRLPVGGGIGGGSSNCATALVALNYHWQLGLSLSELAALGLSLGADVPIFIHGKTAFVEGIGEKITPLKVPQHWYLVVYPGCHISTAKIFSNPLLTRNSKAIKIRDLNALDLPYQGRNSMQSIVCDAYPEVSKALDWLQQENPGARMTGSGSCLFAPFDNEEKVRTIASRCEWPNFVARGVETSPLHLKLSKITETSI